MSSIFRTLVTVLPRDFRIGARRLWRTPGPTVVVVMTLALGIGLNTLVFMLADTILLRPLPYPEADRLISIATNTGGAGWYGSSEPELFDLEGLEVFDAVGAWSGGFYPLAGPEHSRRVRVAQVNAALLPGLGVTPALGRFPDLGEDQPGGDAVAVVSHGFWQRELGGRAEALGESIRLRGTETRIVGVMPADFRFPSPKVEAWVPLQLDRQDPFARNNHYLSVIAKTKADVSVDEAKTAVETLVARSALQYPEFYSDDGYRAQVQALRQAVTANERLPMLFMVTAVGLLLLLTCANVANVQLGRGASRARALAVQRSLGASRGHLMTEFLAESVLLAATGAAVALAVAMVGEALLPRYLPEELLRLGEPTLDLRVLLFTLSIAFLTTLTFGLWPAFRSTSSPSRGSSEEISMAALTRSGGRSRWLRSGLVVGQMALAVILLIGCGMIARSLQRLVSLDPGFNPESVLVIESLPDAAVLDTPQKVVDHYRSVEQMLSGAPGIEAVGALARLPMTGTGGIWSIEIEGQPVAQISDAPAAQVQQASPGAFRALEIPLLRGRLLDASDTAGSAFTVVVNEAFATEFWPGESALGRRFRVYDEGAPWMTVVGIVETIRDGRLDSEGLSQWYVPHAQAFETAYVSPRNMAWVIKTSTDAPLEQAASILARLKDFDERVLYVEPASLASQVSTSLDLPRQLALWLGVFAAVAILLASLGLYGVLSYLVAVRRPEIGIRLALGAAPRSILYRILGEGMGLCAVGLVVGVAAGLLFSRGTKSLFFGATVVDPAVLGAVLVILFAIGSLAPLAPAWRASRTDPTRILRGN